MKTILALVLTTLLLSNSPPGSTQEPQPLPTPTCAWQYEFTPFGLGNWLWADTANRWWYMPIDAQWQELKLTGTFPKARFFSIAVYDNAPVSNGIADHLFDAQIVPDPGSINPFVPPYPSKCSSSEPHHRGRCNPFGSPQAYTITVVRGTKTNDNVLKLNADSGWLLYRLYLPNAGESSMGGVSLPEVRITYKNGQTTQLPICPIFNRQSELVPVQTQIIPMQLEYPLDPEGGIEVPPVPDHIWFGAIKEPPPMLLPNPDQKYLVSFFMPEYEPDRLIVIRGKMPAYPDTYNGRPVWFPAKGFKSVQLRYWGACLGELVSPLPVISCATDAGIPLDRHDFYTIVISNDVLRPDWLPRTAVWLSWGDETNVPKLIFMRNLLAADDFSQSVQEAIEQGCWLNLQFPTPPTQEDIRVAGECAQGVMGAYYPKAVWCDKKTFIKRGWRACFRAADVPVGP